MAVGAELVCIFDLGGQTLGEPGVDQALAGDLECEPWWRRNFRFKPLGHRLAMCFGPKRMRRDSGAIQERLVASWQDASDASDASKRHHMPNGILLPNTNKKSSVSAQPYNCKEEKSALKQLK